MFKTILDEQTDETMTEKPRHIPVMSQEILSYLNLSPGAVFVDCTLGLGGHSLSIAEKIGPQGRIIGIDRDAESLQVARRNLSAVGPQCQFIQEDFRHIDKILNRLGITAVDGILFDLGISSFQLDNPQRGFSLKSEGPLDMRMDRDTYLSAYDLINSLSEKELAAILKDYGEERWHNRIARHLVEERSKQPLMTTKELSDVVLRAVPRYQKWQKIHPATRTFQAFRIVVNRELESLEITLEKAVDYLKSGGRICVVSFHSLEDRIVKHKFRAFVKSGRLKLIEKKPLRPQETEENANPRARSARLRVAERI